MKRAKQTSAGKKIIRGLTELAESLERGDPSYRCFTVKTVKLPQTNRSKARLKSRRR